MAVAPSDFSYCTYNFFTITQQMYTNITIKDVLLSHNQNIKGSRVEEFSRILFIKSSVDSSPFHDPACFFNIRSV